MIRIIGSGEPPTPKMEVIPVTPEEAVRSLDRLERARKNHRWFGQHSEQIGREHAGRHVCVAGEELFVGDDPKEVYERAKAAHPDDVEAIVSKYVRPDRRAVSDAY